MPYKHIADAIKNPATIELYPNLFGLRFESMKVASALKAVKTLLESKVISQDTILVDSSSGIYAYALALACHKYRIQSHIFASTAVDETLLYQLRALGAEVTQVPPSTSLKFDQEQRVALVKDYLRRYPQAYWMRQYHDNIHYLGYSEIASNLLESEPKVFKENELTIVWPVGWGASSCGFSSRLIEAGVKVTMIGIQPFGSVSFGSQNIEDPDILVAGIGSAIPFDNIDYKTYDYIHWINAEIAKYGSMKLLQEAGIFAGLSSGAAFFVADHLRRLNPSQKHLVIFPDMGYRYVGSYICGNDITVQKAPKEINTLNELSSPWSSIHWAKRDYTPK